MKSIQKISINPANAILMVVDMENEFLRPGGARYNEITTKIGPGVIAAAKSLIERSRAAKVPIIYIQSQRTLKEPEFTVFKRDIHLEQGTWASQIIDEIKPQSGDIVVPKYSHDAFFDGKLDKELKKLVPDPLRHQAVICGGAVNVCVYHCTMGFYLRDYWTSVVTDAVYYNQDFGFDVAMKQYSLKAYPNIFLTRSNLVEVSSVPKAGAPNLVPGS